MSRPSQLNTREGLGAGVAALVRGATITTGASSVSVAIPDTLTGAAPNRIRLAATAACYARLGGSTEATVVESAAGSGYAPLDTITLTGGTFNRPMKLRVDTTKIVSAAVNARGTGYAVNDVITLAGGTASTAGTFTVASIELATVATNAAGTVYAPGNVITLAGGTFSTAATLTVDTTKVVSATVAAGGSGGTDGAGVIVEGTTGTGTKFRASVTITAGAIASVQSISVAGSYTVNPTNIVNEPVILISGGAGLINAALNVVLGVNTVSITTRGNYSVGSASFTQNGATAPAGGTGATFQTGLFGVRTFTISNDGEYSVNTASFTQASVSPSGGTEATFNTALYGPETAAVTDDGDYTIQPSNPVSQGSTSGTGTGATWTVTFTTAAAAGDLLVQPGDAIIIDAVGYDQVVAIQVTGAGILQVQPLEN